MNFRRSLRKPNGPTDPRAQRCKREPPLSRSPLITFAGKWGKRFANERTPNRRDTFSYETDEIFRVRDEFSVRASNEILFESDLAKRYSSISPGEIL